MSHHTSTTPAQQHAHVSANVQAEPASPWSTLAVMLAAQIMVILDISVVNVALPSIGRDLHFDSDQFQWLISAYVLLSGGLLLLGGRLADLFDRRTMFLSGLGLFTAASLMSGLAPSPLALIVSRAAQGAGAALLTPAALSIIMATYTGRQRATALSIWGTVGSMGIGVGVLFGGVLTTYFGWRAVFFINVPIGLVVAVIAARRVSSTSGHGAAAVRRLDVRGAITLVAGLLALVYAIEGTRSHGWTSALTVCSFAAAVALLVGFTVIERTAPEALVPPATWRIRSLVSASTVMAVVTGVVVGAIFISSLFLQQVLGMSAIATGLGFLPLALAITVGAAGASHVIGRVSAKTLIGVGLVITATGAAWLATVDEHASYLADVLPAFIVIGLGVGPMFVAISIAAMSQIDAHQSGLASGVMMTGHEIGAALGVAALTAIGGNLATTAGLLTAFPRACTAIAVALVALAVFTVLAVPNTAGAQHSPGHGHH